MDVKWVERKEALECLEQGWNLEIVLLFSVLVAVSGFFSVFFLRNFSFSVLPPCCELKSFIGENQVLDALESGESTHLQPSSCPLPILRS